jgi:hypothetical protein
MVQPMLLKEISQLGSIRLRQLGEIVAANKCDAP